MRSSISRPQPSLRPRSRTEPGIAGVAEEGVGHRRQLMTALDVEVEQTGEGEIGVLDHVHVQEHVDAPDLLDVLLGQGQRGVGPQCGPLGAGEIEVSRLAHSDQATPALFCAAPPEPTCDNRIMTQSPYPEASQATTVLVLGILGIVICEVLGPFAWSMGNKEMQAIDAGRRPPENRGTANAGKILGIVSTVLLAIGIVFIVLIVIGTVTFSAFDELG